MQARLQTRISQHPVQVTAITFFAVFGSYIVTGSVPV
jgi:hypothetical protein